MGEHGEHRPLVRRAGLALAAAAALAAAPAEACRLALALAIDVSRSVDGREFALQFGGLADAFRDAEVRAAILGGEAVAVAAFEWSGAARQAVAADWTLLERAGDIDRLADRLEGHARVSAEDWTSVGAALAFARRMLARGPACARRVIDVSGDGHHNDGPLPRQVYAGQDFGGVTVNALVVTGLARPKLMAWFEREVIRGPRAFALATRDFDDYGGAIRRKLLRELTPEAQLAGAPEGG